MKTKLPSHLLKAAIFAMSAYASAAPQTWDNGQANLLWDTTSTNWDAGSTWTSDNDAIFGATGVGTITIDAGGISAHNVDFNTTGYTLVGGTLTLINTGTTPTITTAASVSASIESVIDG